MKHETLEELQAKSRRLIETNILMLDAQKVTAKRLDMIIESIKK